MKKGNRWYWDSFLDMPSGRGFAAMVSTGLFLLITVTVVLVERSDYITARAKIAQLREDAALVSEIMGEDVQGQVTEWNQTIRSKQRWNRVPIIGLMIPNGWDEIPLIVVR